MNDPFIVCAAARHRDTGHILCGPRHHHVINSTAMLLGRNEWWANWRGQIDQGFVDQRMNFYTREEAWKIAEANGQIKRVTGTPGTLYSEDLY